MKSFLTILRWFFAIIFCIGAFGGFSNGEIGYALLTLLLGILLFPPVTKALFRRKTKPLEQPFLSQENSSSSKQDSFQMKTSDSPYPDRTNAIEYHTMAIKKGLTEGDILTTNLSYAKLVESIRQQNVTENGTYDYQLEKTIKEYDEFRELYCLEYPQEFLPIPKVKSQKVSADVQKSVMLNVTSNNLKLNSLLTEISSKSHPEYPLLRKEYAVSSSMPYKDFSKWVIDQLSQKDYNSLYAFVKELYLGRENDQFLENELKISFEKFITINFKALFKEIDEQAIYELQAFFILKGGINNSNREFWIVEDREAELLSKIISVYSFEIIPESFEPLIKKANKFIQEMRKDVESWNEFETYKKSELSNEYRLKTTKGLDKKLQLLSPGERLHFFDFATTYSYRKFWNGDSTYKTRSYGINEIESINKISELEIFKIAHDINSIPEICSKSELKENAEKSGFEIKKSWTMEKIFENLLKTESGKIFLQSFIKDKMILVFNEEFRDDLTLILDQQSRIKRTIDLITMI